VNITNEEGVSKVTEKRPDTCTSSQRDVV